MPDTGLRVAFVTLGCKLNQFESDALASEFRTAGYAISQDAAKADICVINGCTVTDGADRKSRSAVRRSLNLPQGPRLVVISGCFSPDQAFADDTRVLVVPTRNKSHIPSLVSAHLRGLEMPVLQPANFGFSLADGGFHTRGSIKVQDGCDSFCAYCIIPQVRGSGISRPMPEILSEVRLLASRGYREIILTGVNISRYQFEELDFTGLVRGILNLELPESQDFRLRIGSLEPVNLGAEFITLFRNPRLCPSLHLCLQSGSDTILQSMRRDYTVKEFSRLVLALRQIDPDFTISTDLITGFPGESQSDFERSLDILEALQIVHAHVFPYSTRSGTAAATMQNQIPDHIKNSRADRIRAADRLQRPRWLQRFVNQPSLCLVEQIEYDSDSRGQKTILLKGRNRYGLVLQTSLLPAVAASLLAHLPAAANPRPLTPAMVQQKSILGEFTGFWNQEILLIPVTVDFHGQDNPEPYLVCQPAGNAADSAWTVPGPLAIL